MPAFFVRTDILRILFNTLSVGTNYVRMAPLRFLLSFLHGRDEGSQSNQKKPPLCMSSFECGEAFEPQQAFDLEMTAMALRSETIWPILNNRASVMSRY